MGGPKKIKRHTRLYYTTIPYYDSIRRCAKTTQKVDCGVRRCAVNSRVSRALGEARPDPREERGEVGGGRGRTWLNAREPSC